jgi:hypothetical protein
MKIKLASDATVTVNGNCGSSDSKKSVTLAFGDVSKEIAGKTSAADYTSDVSAGELTIQFTSDDTTFKIVSVKVEYKEDPFKKVENGAVYVTDTDTYVIAGVDSLDADSLSVTVGSTKKATETTDTVYTAVQIGDEKITAEQVGKKYLYAIKLAGANKNKAAETFTVE